MIAALLDLEEGAGAAFDGLDRGAPRSRVTVMMSATSIRGRSPAARRVKVSRRELLLIAQHLVDLGHGGEAGGIDLGGAAGDDDARLGMLAPRLADRLARLALASAVTAQVLIDHGVGEPGRGGMAAHDLGLEGVEPAAEGDDLDHGIGHGPGRRCAKGSSPAKLTATGPVMRTMIVGQPFDLEAAAVEQDLGRAGR